MSKLRELVSEYQQLTLEITRLKQKSETVYSAAASPKIKNITGMPMAPGFSNGGLADVLIRVEEIQEQICVIEGEREEVAEAIEGQLDLIGLDGTERVVFWYREVQGKKWKEISELTNKSVRQLQRIFKKAIYNVMLL